MKNSNGEWQLSPTDEILAAPVPEDERANTWVGSMMSNQWVYDGELDADERVLTLSRL